MFSTPAYAAAGAAGGSGSFLIQILPLVLIFVIFWFLLIRPQQKRMKEHKEMIGNLRRGDVVVTSGGVIGKVTKVDDAEVTVEIAENTRVKVVRGMISEVRSKPEPASKPAAANEDEKS
ncbi:preprotein translocase subunit YajC [Euryhalocaulis caribicus]|uniref:preprotein translocase subunit YajC n=1 Tax=Euryhalocaulis caribicus TaxID=1161401 RepID=UPI00039D70AF|nr:preprotein translocase subunit YajC [Euryhalocaulis caribicus]